MTDEIKTKLFNEMLELEHKSELYCEGKLFDKVNYFERANGAFRILQLLGLASEYFDWAIGK